MKIAGEAIAVTGAGRGLGAEVCRLASFRGADGVVVIDRDAHAAVAVAADVYAMSVTADVDAEAGFRGAIDQAIGRFDSLDVLASNAGHGGDSDSSAPMSSGRSTGVSACCRTYGQRGRFVRDACPPIRRAGLDRILECALLESGFDVVCVTIHVQLAVGESLAMTCGSRGIEASRFCPKGMLTSCSSLRPSATHTAERARADAGTPIEAAGMRSTWSSPVQRSQRPILLSSRTSPRARPIRRFHPPGCWNCTIWCYASVSRPSEDQTDNPFAANGSSRAISLSASACPALTNSIGGGSEFSAQLSGHRRGRRR